MKSRSGHFGDILARDRKIDLDTFSNLPSRLDDEPRKGARDTLLDPLR